jgi:putative DNA primase/helicase
MVGSDSMMTAALDWVGQGFGVFPCCWPTADGGCDCGRGHTGRDVGKAPLTPHGLKNATMRESVVREYWGRWPRANIGLATDGLLVLDFDGQPGIAGKKAIEAEHGSLPITRRHLTGGGGEHLIYRNPNGTNARNATVLGGYQGVDLRANGGYIIAPPSVHRNGLPYTIAADCEIALAPDWLVDAAIKKTRPRGVVPAGEVRREGQRNSGLASLAGTMRRRGMPLAAIEAALLQVNLLQCEPPLSEEEVLRIAKSVARYLPAASTAVTPQVSPSVNGVPTPAPSSGMPGIVSMDDLNDVGNERRFSSMFGNDVRYCHERAMFLTWEGTHWAWDESGLRVTRMAEQVAASIYGEAAVETDTDRRKEIAGWASTSHSEARLKAMMNLSKAEPGIALGINDFDKDVWLFNLLNGTLNLRNGQLQPHCKHDLITIVVRIDFDPSATCPTWLLFLDKVTGKDKDLEAYLQRAVGYSLTGDIRTQVLFFLYGLGSNGKSTFVLTVRKLCGEFGTRVNTDLLMLADRNSGGPKEGLANLKGKRFVVASEVEDGKRLATGLIKDLTGGEPVRADRKYEHEIEFTPTHKIWLSGNHKPAITDGTYSIWRRVKLIPFTVKIPPEDVDEQLPAKLEAELPGILAWAVNGCLDWQKMGLKEPQCVSTAIADYRKEEDLIEGFLDDCCVCGQGREIAKAALRAAYDGWCATTGSQPLGQRALRSRLIERGITEGKSGGVRNWKGIALAKSDTEG